MLFNYGEAKAGSFLHSSFSPDCTVHFYQSRTTIFASLMERADIMGKQSERGKRGTQVERDSARLQEGACFRG